MAEKPGKKRIAKKRAKVEKKRSKKKRTPVRSPPPRGKKKRVIKRLIAKKAVKKAAKKTAKKRAVKKTKKRTVKQRAVQAIAKKRAVKKAAVKKAAVKKAAVKKRPIKKRPIKKRARRPTPPRRKKKPILYPRPILPRGWKKVTIRHPLDLERMSAQVAQRIFEKIISEGYEEDSYEYQILMALIAAEQTGTFNQEVYDQAGLYPDYDTPQEIYTLWLYSGN
jgi:hypothetical protein